jgi:competence protein ComEA
MAAPSNTGAIVMKSTFFRIGYALVFACTGLAAAAGPVNINTADAAKLASELQGVGPALAEAIVADRQANGNFATPEALMRVKGIGARIVEINKANILVADPAPPPAR